LPWQYGWNWFVAGLLAAVLVAVLIVEVVNP
jgi:hypothetical protein